MSTSLSNIEIQQFISDAHAEFQSTGFLLDNACRMKTGTRGEIINFPVFGYGVANQKAPQDDVTPLNIDSRNVALTVQDWFAAEYVDRTFKKQIAVNATQEYSQLCAQALGRRSDQLVIDALVAGNYAGGAGQGNTVTVAGDLDYPTFTEAFRNIRRRGASLGDVYFVMDAVAEYGLMQSIQLTNNQWMPSQALANNGMSGMKIMGVNCIVLPDMPEGGLPSGTAYMMNKQAMAYAANERLDGTIDWVAQKASYLIDLWMESAAGIIDNTGIVKVEYTV